MSVSKPDEAVLAAILDAQSAVEAAGKSEQVSLTMETARMLLGIIAEQEQEIARLNNATSPVTVGRWMDRAKFGAAIR